LVRAQFRSMAATVSTFYNVPFPLISSCMLNKENPVISWRVLEISDIILIIVDIRHPVLHLPTTLYRYVTEELGRKVVCVFNKVQPLLKIIFAQNICLHPSLIFLLKRLISLPKKQFTHGENISRRSILSYILPLSVASHETKIL
jgi:hypothetical protein